MARNFNLNQNDTFRVPLSAIGPVGMAEEDKVSGATCILGNDGDYGVIPAVILTEPDENDIVTVAVSGVVTVPEADFAGSVVIGNTVGINFDGTIGNWAEGGHFLAYGLIVAADADAETVSVRLAGYYGG